MDSNETYDIIIAGGGTSGAALAGILARDTSLNVLLLEAGPDYGLLADGNWPPDLLESLTIPSTHDWGYSGIAHTSQREATTFDRARVIGGCSSHNGCVALGGHRRDYDAWAAMGNSGWDWASVEPAFERAKQALKVRIPADEELVPYQKMFLDAAVAAGIPRVADLNEPDDPAGVAPSPVNIHNGMRWNTSLAYLDPVRNNDNLTIIGDVLVDRVTFDGDTATGVQVVHNGEPHVFTGRKVVLSAGAYGSPAILLRSGVGPADELQALGVPLVRDIPAVGRNLADHPAVRLTYRAGNALDDQMTAFGNESWLPDEQTLAKARSRHCTEAFDLHLYPTTSHDPETGEWRYSLYISSVLPRSSGRVTLGSTDPNEHPVIDHGYLSDLEGEDAAVLLDGLRIARKIMQPLLDSGVLAEEITPGATVVSDEDLETFIAGNVGIYYHPACSCRMGPPDDENAVVDASGKVHGLDGLHVCDASIFPVLMRANTNLPAAMVAEVLATRLAR